MNRINKLEVYYHDARVGTMALYQNRWLYLNMIMTGLQMAFQSALFHYRWRKRYLCLK